MDGADGVAFRSAGSARAPWPDGGDAFTAELAQAKQQQAVADAWHAAGSTDNNPSQSTDDPISFLPELPSPPDPPSGAAPATVTPACHVFEAVGQVGGGILGGTAEGLRQAAPGALAGTVAGTAAGATVGVRIGTGAGAFADGVGALPGAGIGATTGALLGGVSGAVVGGAPGLVHGFQDGMGAGAKLGASAGRWLDNTSVGRWAQGCHAAVDDTTAKGPPTFESRGDQGLTRPTGHIGGTPTGPRSTTKAGANSEIKAQVDSENQVADTAARAGYRTVQSPTKGSKPALTPERLAADGLNPRANPDLLLENHVWDTYTPEADSAAGVRNGIDAKVGKAQTHRVLVDLRGTSQTEATVRAALRAAPVRGLREVMVLTQDGLGRPFRP